MSTPTQTPEEYLATVPAERRDLVERVRATILERLPDGLEETVAFGMLAYVVPLATFPDTYNGQPLGLVALAGQKRHVAVYLMGVYGDDAERAWFEDAWRATGRSLDMGRACVRVRKTEDVAFDVLGEAVSRVGVDALVAAHEAAHASRRSRRRRPAPS